MNKALEELIESAEVKREGTFFAFLMIPNGTYNGCFGKNGYENILLLGQDFTDRKWYKIADKIDAIHFFYPPALNWEINSCYGVPCVWTHTPIIIKYDGITSSLISCESTSDLVPKARYARLLANATIVSNALNEYRTGDYVKVVRCKDCRFSILMKEKDGSTFRVCYHPFLRGQIVEDTDFCKKGRRDNEHD